MTDVRLDVNKDFAELDDDFPRLPDLIVELELLLEDVERLEWDPRVTGLLEVVEANRDWTDRVEVNGVWLCRSRLDLGSVVTL